MLRLTAGWVTCMSSATRTVEPAIVALAERRGILTGIDDTWAIALLFKPLAHGVPSRADLVARRRAGDRNRPRPCVSSTSQALPTAVTATVRQSMDRVIGRPVSARDSPPLRASGRYRW